MAKGSFVCPIDMAYGMRNSHPKAGRQIARSPAGNRRVDLRAISKGRIGREECARENASGACDLATLREEAENDAQQA